MTDDPQKLAIAFWLLNMVLVLFDTFLPERIVSEPAYYIGTGVLVVFLAFGWLLADARRLGVSVSPGLKIAAVVLTPVAIPYYRFRRTGLLPGVRFLGIVLALYALLIGLQIGLLTLLES